MGRPEGKLSYPETITEPKREKKHLFFPGRDSASEKPKMLRLLKPLSSLFLFIKVFSFSCSLGTYMCLNLVTDSELQFSDDPVFSGEVWQFICFRAIWYIQHSFWCCCWLVAESCLTFCDPMDCRPPCCSVHGICQARILEQVATSFSRGSSGPRDQACLSRIGRWIL